MYLDDFHLMGVKVSAGSFPPDIIDKDELEERCVDEEHGEPVPDVHGREVRDDREGRTEAIAVGREVRGY